MPTENIGYARRIKGAVTTKRSPEQHLDLKDSLRFAQARLRRSVVPVKPSEGITIHGEELSDDMKSIVRSAYENQGQYMRLNWLKILTFGVFGGGAAAGHEMKEPTTTPSGEGGGVPVAPDQPGPGGADGGVPAAPDQPGMPGNETAPGAAPDQPGMPSRFMSYFRGAGNTVRYQEILPQTAQFLSSLPAEAITVGALAIMLGIDAAGARRLLKQTKGSNLSVKELISRNRANKPSVRKLYNDEAMHNAVSNLPASTGKSKIKNREIEVLRVLNKAVENGGFNKIVIEGLPLRHSFNPFHNWSKVDLSKVKVHLEFENPVT